MGQDHPDWGGLYVDKQFFPLFDLAEVAARLGSVITYDRRGSLIWYHDFADGIGSVLVGGVLGDSYELHSTIYERPPFSMKLLTGTNAGSQSYVARRLPLPRSKEVGFQVSVRPVSGVDTITVKLSHFTGSEHRFGIVYVDLKDSNLEMLDESAGVVVLNSDLPDISTGAYFAHVKVVCDFDDNTYIRGLIDDNEYDLTAYEMGSSTDSDAPHLEIKVLITNDGAVEAVCYVDSLVVTAAEPPN